MMFSSTDVGLVGLLVVKKGKLSRMRLIRNKSAI